MSVLNRMLVLRNFEAENGAKLKESQAQVEKW